MQRWADDGGALPPREERPVQRAVPPVWPPAALHARLAAEQALSELPRPATGISAEARATLARIVADVGQCTLTPDSAADQLRQLTARLLLHGRARNTMRGHAKWLPMGQRHRSDQ